MFLERMPEFVSNHLMLVAAFAAVLAALVGQEVGRLTRKYKTLSPAQLTQLINRDGALVIDVRAINDFQSGHVPGSRHVAMSQFDPENKELAKLKDLPVAVVCKTGQTSGDAANRLAKAGFGKVYSLEGGIEAWRGAELPVAKGNK